MLLPTTSAMTGILEAVRITEPSGWSGWTDTVPGDTIALWEDAQEVLALVAALPASERMRCFVPGYAIRAHCAPGLLFEGQVLFEIAFCFRCRWARFHGAAVTADVASQTFDPGSAPALELLRRFREGDAAG